MPSAGFSKEVTGALRRGGHRAEQRVIETVGGGARARVIGLLAAGPLEHALHINNLQVGLLVALPSLVGALATVPIGALTDRVARVSLLQWSIVLWCLTMIVAGASTSFEMLLVSRLVLGGAIATTGPTLASLTGDYFPSRERAKIYGFILTGDLVGSVLGLEISGNLASITWRLAFWVLAIPSAILAGAIWRLLPEPARGGASRLEPRATEASRSQPAAPGSAGEVPEAQATGGSAPELEQAVKKAGVQPRPENLLTKDPARMKLGEALRYVLRVPTNVALIIASSLNYFFISGILTFGVLFIRHQYAVGQSVATSLLGLIAIAAVVGVLVSGRLADALVRRGRPPRPRRCCSGWFPISSPAAVRPRMPRGNPPIQGASPRRF
jgi:predicted MFS family arabinose efflux permease